MPLSEGEALTKIAEAIQRESKARLANSPAYRHLSMLTLRECEYLAAIAIQAMKDAGYSFGAGGTS
jgi:hypothetical protein